MRICEILSDDYLNVFVTEACCGKTGTRSRKNSSSQGPKHIFAGAMLHHTMYAHDFMVMRGRVQMSRYQDLAKEKAEFEEFCKVGAVSPDPLMHVVANQTH